MKIGIVDWKTVPTLVKIEAQQSIDNHILLAEREVESAKQNLMWAIKRLELCRAMIGCDHTFDQSYSNDNDFSEICSKCGYERCI